MRSRFTKYIALFCTAIMLLSIGGVWATWKYANFTPKAENKNVSILMNEFDYTPSMPEGEVSILQRLHDLLNNNYTNDVIAQGESMNYLLSTLDKDWDTGLNHMLGSFVGSMDPTAESKSRINVMFGDIMELNHVSFILKSEDLVGSVANEIAIYSTSDPLDWSPTHYISSVVGVYLSVFILSLTTMVPLSATKCFAIPFTAIVWKYNIWMATTPRPFPPTTGATSCFTGTKITKIHNLSLGKIDTNTSVIIPRTATMLTLVAPKLGLVGLTCKATNGRLGIIWARKHGNVWRKSLRQNRNYKQKRGNISAFFIHL